MYPLSGFSFAFVFVLCFLVGFLGFWVFCFVFFFEGRNQLMCWGFVVVVEDDLSHLFLFLAFINVYKPERKN